MRGAIVFKVICFLVLLFAFLDAQVLNNLDVVKNLKGGVNTFGFQPNMGQVGDLGANHDLPVKDVLFFTRHSGIDLYVRESGVSYVIRDVKVVFLDRVLHKSRGAIRKVPLFEGEVEQDTMIWARVDLNLVGGVVREEMIEYSEPMEGYTNYYLAHCPDGVLFVPSYRVVKIKEVYPGIDWVWRIGEDGMLHHEFEVKEGANVEKIKLEVKYADVKLSGDGKRLRLKTPVGEIEDGEIFGYDEKGKVELSYVVDEGKIVSFKVEGEYQGRLTIDPPLARLWATYYGGGYGELGLSITTDTQGNVFVIGGTWSLDFPTQDPGGGAYYQGSYGGGGIFGGDVFIIKFTNNGTKQWATYYGGSDGDFGLSIATDAQGNVFVSGTTVSMDLPTYNPGGGAYFQGNHAGGGLRDAFILKFTNNGVRLWATYYGGRSSDYAWSITTDAQGNVFVSGTTVSSDFPTYNPGGGAYFQGSFSGGFYDAFILKFTNNGVRLWATYYGGMGEDQAYSIATDAQGNVFVTGYTLSTDFPTYDPGGGAYFQGSKAGYYSDAFILKFSNNGVRRWATYYGGNQGDYAWSITTDAQGNVFVTGRTSSTDFPTYDPGGGAYFQGSYGGGGSFGGDVFILKFSNDGVRLWATYYGGSDGFEEGLFIATDVHGNVFVTGYTGSVDFPTYNPGGAYYQGSYAGNYDAFILKFEGSGTTGVGDEVRGIPKVFVVYQNYPNPFNLGTEIRFDLPEDGDVKVEVYNLLGERVAVLYDGFMEAGFGKVIRWDAVGMSSGVYFYRVSLNNRYVGVKKMVLVK